MEWKHRTCHFCAVRNLEDPAIDQHKIIMKDKSTGLNSVAADVDSTNHCQIQAGERTYMSIFFHIQANMFPTVHNAKRLQDQGHSSKHFLPEIKRRDEIISGYLDHEDSTTHVNSAEVRMGNEF